MSETISRRRLLRTVVCGGLAAAAAGLVGYEAWRLLRRRSMDELYGAYPDARDLSPPRVIDASAPKPNVVIFYCDDLGYGDIGCYGSTAIRTPSVDRLAAEGLRATDFYACSGICAPSRAGLLTGRYPFRAGMTGNPYPVDEALAQTAVRNFGNQMSAFGSMDQHEVYYTQGLSDRELTLAQALKAAGYYTAMIGKWHLGDFSAQPEFNPRRFGFDRYFGVPHSNDMRPCPLFRDERMEIADILGILPSLTGRYTAEAVDVIESARGRPFLLYLAHTMPHQPLAASAAFAGKSRAGRFGDAVEELDWSVGQVVAALERTGVADDTIVIFTSDNGPWYEGSAGALRGGKGQGYDGAFKVPFVARWPRRIGAGRVTNELLTNMDLFPTLLGLAGVDRPRDRVIDGVDVLGILDGSAARSPRESFFYYHYDELQAVRFRNWKYIRHTNRYVWPVPLDGEAVPGRLGLKQLGPDRVPLLYDLTTDPGERYNLIAHQPEIARRLDELMTDWQSRQVRNPRGFTLATAWQQTGA